MNEIGVLMIVWFDHIITYDKLVLKTEAANGSLLTTMFEFVNLG